MKIKLLYITICCLQYSSSKIASFSAEPAVTLILHPNRNWTSIICPQKATGIKKDVNAKDTISSNVVKFDCTLVERDKKLIFLPYHLSMFPLLHSNAFGCKKLDNCFIIDLAQEKPNIIKVHAKSLKTCLSATIPFRIELRQGNRLIHESSVDVVFGRKPEPPTYLQFRTNTQKRVYIEGHVKYICAEDLKGLSYLMNYEIKGEGCMIYNHSECEMNKVNSNYLNVSCLLPDVCEPKAFCSAVVFAYIVGVNKLGQIGEVSRKFSKPLAFAEIKSLAPNVTMKSLNSLTVSFRRPVSCSSSHQQFQYKISYKKLTQKLWVSYEGKSCNRNNKCNIYLAGLQMHSNYNICISYQNIFDYASSYSKPSCTNATTAQLPCQAPVVYNITPIEMDTNFWKASVQWNLIPNHCWNDMGTQHYYLVEISDGNLTKSYKRSSYTNSSLNGLSHLLYEHRYSLTLSSCNLYGCFNGPKNFLYINKRVNEAITQDNSKQTITEMILICVLSLLFLAASTVLYFILKKRKQRLRLRRLRGEDIQLVLEEPFVMNRIASRGLMEEIVEAQPKEHVIKIDTRQLIARNVSAPCLIPENSTLV